MAKEDEMIFTGEQLNVLEEVFVEMLRCLQVISANPKNIRHLKVAKSRIFGWILCLQYNCVTKSFNDFTFATEEPRLVNAYILFVTVTKTTQNDFFE